MAAIVHSIEISRSPQDVFSYLTDIPRSREWQESLVRAQLVEDSPLAVGSRVIQTRRTPLGERTMTMEVTEYSPPRRYAFRGIDGPIRAIGQGTVEPLGDGTRSRVTIELDFEGHGIGKLLVPLVRRQARSEVPRNEQQAKERLEGGTV